MNKTFLEYVATDLLDKFSGNMAHVAVVFPNKRASLFLNQTISKLSRKPVWSPHYITISELFRQHSELTIADPIKTISELHKSYNEITGSDEDLDKFFSWGQILLADFDDIDKNMADASKVFQNLSDLHEMDDLSYLDEYQIGLLRRFFGNFNSDKTALEERFLEVWSKLSDVYTDFRTRLRNQGLAYEGMLYRDVIEGTVEDFDYDKYVFIGFNVLQRVEQRLFINLKKEDKALFYWDYDHYYLDNDNEAGFYVRQWLQSFPNELNGGAKGIYDNMSGAKKVRFMSSPTETLQAQYISQWLRENDRYKANNKTAIVLCDENLLQTVVHCIPPEVTQLNITTGYPLSRTPIASLIPQILNLQLKGWDDKRQKFRLHYVNAVLRHPYVKYLSSDATDLYTKLNTNKVFYVSDDELALNDAMAALFTRDGLTVDTNIRPDGYDLGGILLWMSNIVKQIAINFDDSKDPLTEESLFRMYKLLNNLHNVLCEEDENGSSISDEINIFTFQHFLNQIISSTTIPFHGEPAIGVQVMGVLETRNLDFDHILILSCNEGKMPKGVHDTSLIPHVLRSAYGLTTIDNKVAIYSYYFYSMLQRASDVTILYNSSTEGLNSGEMSRFMLQLMVEKPASWDFGLYSLQSGQISLPFTSENVGKSKDVMERLDGMKKMSPTAINTYIRCGMQFFYKYVAGIKETDNIDDDEIDNRIFGNIFHRAAELIYSKPELKIDTILNIAFNEELFHLPEGTDTEPQLNGMQLINRTVIKRYLLELKELDKNLGKFKVIGHEADVSMKLPLKDRTLEIGGRIDRLDRVNIGEPNERLRVIDYKTGNKVASDIDTVEDIFDNHNIQSKHSDYILQAMLYSIIEQNHDEEHNPQHINVSPALLFIQHTKAKDYDPVLTIAKEPITDVNVYKDDFLRLLKEKLDELYNPDIPFELTDNADFCRVCPYKNICGRR